MSDPLYNSGYRPEYPDGVTAQDIDRLCEPDDGEKEKTDEEKK